MMTGFFYVFGKSATCCLVNSKCIFLFFLKQWHVSGHFSIQPHSLDFFYEQKLPSPLSIFAVFLCFFLSSFLNPFLPSLLVLRTFSYVRFIVVPYALHVVIMGLMELCEMFKILSLSGLTCFLVFMLLALVVLQNMFIYADIM